MKKKIQLIADRSKTKLGKAGSTNISTRISAEGFTWSPKHKAHELAQTPQGLLGLQFVRTLKSFMERVRSLKP